MPYIEEFNRWALGGPDGRIPVSAGELNYKISTMLIAYMEAHEFNYQTINDIIGALEGAKAEFQRRVVAPYEDRKIAENGDLPWPRAE